MVQKTSITTIQKKSVLKPTNLKVLFLGNADNANLRLCLWSKKMGVDAHLWRTDEYGRGNPHDYAPEIFENGNPDWLVEKEPSIKKLLMSTIKLDSDIKRINQEFDVVVISGLRALIFSLKISIPKMILPVGYEVGELAYDRSPLQKIKEILCNPKSIFEFYLQRKKLDALKKMDGIFDAWPPHLKIYKQFGLTDLLYPKSIGEDCEKVRNFFDKALLKTLEAKTKNNKRVFLWFSRLIFKNPGNLDYKGVELYLKALENNIESLENGDIALYIGKHGTDAEAFFELAKKSPVYKYINWVGHLEYPQLFTYLLLPNAVLCTEFSELNPGLTGIGRDALTLGTVTISSCTDVASKIQHGAPAPTHYAKTVSEITHQINKLVHMPDKKFKKFQEMNKAYADEYLDYKNYLPWFYEDVEKIYHAHKKEKNCK